MSDEIKRLIVILVLVIGTAAFSYFIGRRDERDELRDENQKLRNYIKKLENVGDYWMTSDWISNYGMQNAKKEWNKAKESKP